LESNSELDTVGLFFIALCYFAYNQEVPLEKQMVIPQVSFPEASFA